MKLAIMQPYFLPYLGYWQLINAVDQFIVYDKIQFTKKGWVHRNRFSQNGKDVLFTLALKKDSDYLDINQRYLSESNTQNIEKIIRQLENSYRKAPHYYDAMQLIVDCLNYSDKNLFNYVYNSISMVNKYLGIETLITKSSDLIYNNNLKAQNKVIDICRACNAETYINLSGGIHLYNKNEFNENNINLRFIKMNDIEYNQFEYKFISNLSIVDLLMFLPKTNIVSLLDEYTLS